MSIAPAKPLDLQEISQVINLQSSSEVNRHLALGWVLLGLSSNQHSEHGYTLSYHLGWQRNLGEPQRADSDMEAWLKDDSTPPN
jgi:hypothetical protein